MSDLSSSPPPARIAAPAWRDLTVAVVGGALAYALSCLIVPPGPEALTFGAQWQRMSSAPFDLLGQFPHRDPRSGPRVVPRLRRGTLRRVRARARRAAAGDRRVLRAPARRTMARCSGNRRRAGA